ncbi:alkanesulfonate monooxygenase SsuD/methylene tetrahydromethanopterin reductase-like flavin-dependent oxidoreductase (luciferase family) [Labedella gwakjiensis]|uniref:Alkanesulfonate monooxygenase SsuD/methylene tetrahydromethanopterin reductase-like flavin-dependent oxidoreductase (Luciferase family) n=1 Tax=Labedella gwakjiensis TaxID=390269 RepID=A0A2P8GUE7_9MICO|nr:LLM class flavin-dependent oxidoreductase [Labedella gwakjiensis]PSL37588.1 alkanesulfonate monooxygenase SsuD/methylene tetrahydromethanopterin reductase-like flavin-dependent oxidoreductase (luciferase family) [Labedella gwakjiensis]RUQ84887.1 LLM class flavin-dependent oxidoreductase [Labedella gwakjiensis]
MTPARDALTRLGFLTMGFFDPAEPRAGHESTLRLIEFGEQLGFDSAWLRHRHVQFGISSPVAVMAAASQRTDRIELGTAVTPLGVENPFRLAEDLATVDVLSGGRITPGFSTGAPMNFDRYRDAIYPDTAEQENLGYDRLLRLRSFLRGDPIGAAAEAPRRDGIEEFSTRVEPHSAGLADRIWYGAASMRSARWAGENGFRLLTSSVIAGENGTNDFASNQAEQVRAFREVHPDGESARVSQGLVVIPTDNATPSQRARYRDYVDSRSGRVGVPHGPRKLLFAADLLGTAAEIAERLHDDAGFREVDEVAFALPFTLEPDDYTQILGDIAGALGPALGWAPGAHASA